MHDHFFDPTPMALHLQSCHEAFSRHLSVTAEVAIALSHHQKEGQLHFLTRAASATSALPMCVFWFCLLLQGDVNLPYGLYLYNMYPGGNV